METRTLQVNPEDAGARLDAWLACRLPDVTRSAAARLCEEGRVCSAGRPLAKNHRLTGAETVSVALPDPAPIEAAPEDIPLDVVYEDGDVIVVNKPKGLVVHPAPGHPDGTLVNALLHHCGDSLSASAGHCGPASSTGSTGTPPASSSRRKNDFAHQRLLRPAPGPHPLPGLPVHRGGESPGGRGHRGRPHRPLSGGPEEDGRGGRRTPGRHPLDRAGAAARPHLCGVPAGDRPHPPDPGPHGEHRPPHPGGHRCTAAKSPSPASRASASTRWGCGSSTPGPGRRWSSGVSCRRNSRPSCGGWRAGNESTGGRKAPGREMRSGCFLSLALWSLV